MRRAAIFVAALAWAPAAHAAPTILAQASAQSGAAPFHVTFTATGDAVSYHWDFGDGTAGDGAVVGHTYRAGAFTATVTGTGADGSTAQASVRVSSVGLSLTAPRTAVYGVRSTFRGRLVPAARSRVELYLGGKRVAVGSADRKGRVRVRARVWKPGRYQLRWNGIASNGVEPQNPLTRMPAPQTGPGAPPMARHLGRRRPPRRVSDAECSCRLGRYGWRSPYWGAW